MKSIKKQILLFGFVLFSGLAIHAQSLTATLNQILEANYPADQPGATVLVAQNGKVIYRNAYGMANLELDVAMKPEHVFEIGSITKQFTAVAILMLMEDGKVSLNDEITKFMADYPTQGKKITVHQLLNHTSGIKSYTSMESFFARAREDMSPRELIDVFKKEPMDFDPGEEYRYNNSGYILLGHIIEVASGKTYAEYIEENIFNPLGMKDSYYGSHSEIIKNRASGYQPTENGYRNADYLSLTLPYAAGSIMSNVDDLLKWQQALHHNTLISEASKKLAFTNYTLNNGDPIYYGYGFSVDEVNGTPSIEHGGGIFGYETYGAYIPSKDMYAVILTNKNGNGPSDITIEVLSHALGKPYKKAAQVAVSEEEMKKWVGTYEFDNNVIRYITFSDGSLYSQREGSTNLKLNPLGNGQFAFEDSFTVYKFGMENGKKAAVFKSRIREGKGVETDKAPPAERESITLAPDTLKKYEGTYELQPGFDIVITSEGNQLFAQATGQPQFELFAESETKFFLKVVAAQVVFSTDDMGVAESLTLYQGGQEMPGKKKD